MMVRFLIAASLCVCARAVAVGVPTPPPTSPPNLPPPPPPPPFAPGGKCFANVIVDALTWAPGYAPELLAECQVVVGDLELTGDTVPESINMPKLEAVTGKVKITSANKLHSLLLPKLSTAEELSIQFAPKLTNLDLSELSGANLFYAERTSLTQLDLPSLVFSGSFTVFDNIKLTKIYVPQQPAANLTIASFLAIGNPMLDCVDLPITARVNLNIKGTKACDCVGGFSCHKDSCGPPMKSLDSCDGPWEATWIAPRSRECDPEQDRNELCVAQGVFESCICEDHSGAERKILFGAPPKSCFCGVPFVAY